MKGKLGPGSFSSFLFLGRWGQGEIREGIGIERVWVGMTTMC